MRSCSVYDNSLKFSRLIYGILVLVAYFLQSDWLILLVSVLTILGAFSFRFNIPYQLHKDLQKRKAVAPSAKDFGELSFVSGMTGVLLLIGFLLLRFTPYTSFAWIYILVVAAMIFLACLVGFCVATFMYLVIRNKLNPKKD